VEGLRERACPLRALPLAVLILPTACTRHSIVGVLPEAESADDGTAEAVQLPPASETTAPPLQIDACTSAVSKGLDDAAISALRAAGDSSRLRWLYPYDGTVFPRGLLAPVLQWEGPPPDAALVRLTSAAFRYEGCVALDGVSELALDSRTWSAAEAQSQGPADTLHVEVSTLTAGVAHGPVHTSIAISTSRAIGSVYYQTYGSSLAPLSAVGSIIRVPIGGDARLAMGQAACTGCHGIAPRGDGLVASVDGTGRSFKISAGKVEGVSGLAVRLPGAEFAAIEPSGRYYVATAHPVTTGGLGLMSLGADFQLNSGLYTVDTGAAVANSAIPSQAMMASFSADGQIMVFNDAADGAGHSLSIARFDVAPPTFGPARRIFHHAAMYPGWPAFLRGDRTLIFALSEAPSFGADGALLFGSTALGGISRLAVLDPIAGVMRELHRSNGFEGPEAAAALRSYLPYGLDDAARSYYPTVMTTEPGTHNFVCFDSVRHYGGRGQRRAIWCAAVDAGVTLSDVVDPSHPAFYLPGQEDETDNFRPVAAQDPP
jgi:hypothetical protein